MNTEAELREQLSELLASQRLAVLATHRRGQPYCSLVAFVATDDLGELVFATTRATRKFANLTADARVALLIDSRSNQEVDFHEAVAATATGAASEVDSDDRERILELYLAKHPHLREFVNARTCALLRVQVDTYYVVSRFQNVMELHLRT